MEIALFTLFILWVLWRVFRFEARFERALIGLRYPSEGEFQPLRLFKMNGYLLLNGESPDYESFIEPRLRGDDAEDWQALDKLMRQMHDLEVRILDDIRVTIICFGYYRGQYLGWITTSVRT